MAKKISKKQVLDAIQGSCGIISKVQRKLKAALQENFAWETTKKLIEKWEETKKAFQEEKEAILDYAESNIHEAIVSNKDIQVSKWYLMTKGKERGYEPNNTFQIANDEPLNISFEGSRLTREELLKADNIEIGGLCEESTTE